METKAKTEREVFKMVVVGKPGTGKTTKIRELVHACLESGRRVLIVTPHWNEWQDIPEVHPRFHGRIATYKGARRILVREREDFSEVCRLFRHGLLVCDDCRIYVGNPVDQDVRSMLLSCRQNDVDLIAVGHGFTQVPPQFFTYATLFMVFATTDNVSQRKNVVVNYDAVERTVHEVNAAATSDPHTFMIIRNE